MAEIRLEGVTAIYQAGGIRYFPSEGRVRRTYGGYEDRAFVERMAGHEAGTPSRSGPIKALDDLNLTVADGETMAIVGPSGCGKSTLLKVIAGLEPIKSGRVLYDGKDMEGIKPGDRGIGMVFQSYALYPHMKGQGNLGFFFKIRRRPSEEMMERIRITADIMGLGFDDLLPRKPGTLSGGQQQRVAIGRCIVRDPSLFLFDEPLSNLDALLRNRTRVEIKRLLRKFSITAIYVTHDQTEAMTLGDRIAVMRAGKIEQVGDYQTLMERPANSFVAGFLGVPPMNLLKGWQVADSGTLVSSHGTIERPAALAGRTRIGQPLVVGFRSETAQLQIEETEPDAKAGGLILEGEVLNSEPDFARHEQHVNVEVGPQVLGVRASIDVPVNTGWPVRITVPPNALYVFDQETEQRLYPE